MVRKCIWQAFLLCAAASFLVSGATAKTLQLPSHTARSRAWVLSDMNGDKVADIAAAGPNRLEGDGYAREVSVHLAGLGKSRFTVRSAGASIQLSLRDIDGDHDRDLVVLERWSLQPIGIWLNDGSGHFRQGNLPEYAAALGRPGSRSFAHSVSSSDLLFVLHEERTPVAAPAASWQMQLYFRAQLRPEYHAGVFWSLRSSASPRAPPSLT